MKLFSGFPDGKVSVTPLPNLFFSELLPAINDLAELQLTLHIFWLIKNRKASQPIYIRADELRADSTLAKAVSSEKLQGALDAVVARGTLLHHPDNDLYFINDEAGRRAFEKSEIVAEKPTRKREPAPAADRPNIFALYEQNIGMLTPMMAEELKEAEKEFPADWIEEAFKESVKHNKRNWKYVHAILKNWKTEGRGDPSKKNKRWWDGEQDKLVKR